MTISSDGIIATMTIAEAAALWSDPQKEHLRRWAKTFGVPLQELHPGHVATYQKDRGKETTAAQVDVEVEALLALLKQIGLGTRELTQAEITALPEAVRKYIDRLKREISELEAEKERMSNRIRRTNWGRSR
jgi:hypothetical protein